VAGWNMHLNEEWELELRAAKRISTKQFAATLRHGLQIQPHDAVDLLSKVEKVYRNFL
jgi:hypothetical protein